MEPAPALRLRQTPQAWLPTVLRGSNIGSMKKILIIPSFIFFCACGNGGAHTEKNGSDPAGHASNGTTDTSSGALKNSPQVSTDTTGRGPAAGTGITGSSSTGAGPLGSTGTSGNGTAAENKK